MGLKHDIDGSQLRDVFYEENDIDFIISFCEKDTIIVAQILLKLLVYRRKKSISKLLKCSFS